MQKLPNEFVDEVKKKLEEEKNRIIKRLGQMKSQDPYSDQERLNDNAANDTEAKEESDHERVEAIERELKNRLSEVEAALVRISEGTYGICERTGKLIEIERLKINPTATYSMASEK